jgi:hypothetical protein
MPSAPRPLPTVEPALATRRDNQPKTSEKSREKIQHEPSNGDQKVAASDLRQANNLNGAHQIEDMTSVAAKAAKLAKVTEECRAKTFELMTANMNTTLEYAQRLLNVKTPTEFVALSASQACKQLELIIAQTAALGSIAQRLATTYVERLTAGSGRKAE